MYCLLGYLELLGGTLSHSQRFSEALTKWCSAPEGIGVKSRMALQSPPKTSVSSLLQNTKIIMTSA